MKPFSILLLGLSLMPMLQSFAAPADEDGYRLWLRYEPLPEAISQNYSEDDSCPGANRGPANWRGLT